MHEGDTLGEFACSSAGEI